MLAYVVKRSAQALFVLLIVSFIASTFMRLMPGDPASLLAGPEASDETIQAIREDLGLNKSLLTQYLLYLQGVFRGDFGTSYYFGTPVLEQLAERFPKTILLAVVGMLVAVAVGGALGVLAAANRGTLVDQLVMVIALLGVCLPTFWIGLMMMYVFAVKLRLLPAAGTGTWKHLILPGVTLGMYGAGLLARLIRASMLDVLSQEYITVARSKGLSDTVVILKHALRNALLPAITIIGMQFGAFLGKAALTETVFAWPGIARLIVKAVSERDYPLLQGGILWLAAAFSAINLLTDLFYGFLDPRIRYK